MPEGQKPEPGKDGKRSSGTGRTDWEIVRKQKRRGKSKKENPVPTRGKAAPGKATLRRKLPRPKAEAVFIIGSGDNKMSYADRLNELKTKASPDEVGSKVGKIRKIGDGNLLIKLRKDSKLEEVSGVIRRAVGDELLVRPMAETWRKRSQKKRSEKLLSLP